MLTRTLAFFTLVAYLGIGACVVRVLSSISIDVSLSPEILGVFETNFNFQEPENLSPPEIAFTEFKVLENEKIISQSIKKAPVKKEENIPLATEFNIEKVETSSLNFDELVMVEPIYLEEELLTNMVALYKDLETEDVSVASVSEEVIQDEVAVKQAKTEEVDQGEPEFFEYEKTAAPNNEEEVASVEAPEELEVGNLIEEKVKKTEKIDVVKKATTVTNQNYVAINNGPAAPKKLATVLFDYAKAERDIKTHKTPRVSVNSQKNSIRPTKSSKETNEYSISEKSNLVADGYPSRIVIQAVGTDLSVTADKLNSFELRFQDDEGESYSDYGTGEIILNQILSNREMVRNIRILKRGFAPTHSEISVVDGDNGVTIPLIDEEKLKSMLEENEDGSPKGAVLIKTGSDISEIALDVSSDKMIRLDDELQETAEGERYRLYLGVAAGNALVSFKKINGEAGVKIIHVHAQELVFESSMLANMSEQKLNIYEEDLLSREVLPLRTSEDSVRIFPEGRVSKRVDQNSYQLSFGLNQLGGRQYIEMSHQDEPIFVGVRDKKEIVVPSEALMRHILSNVKENQLGSRCLVQVNLSKTVENVEFGVESVESSVMVDTQMLDSDGQFYKSVSEKTKKILLFGESGGALGTNMNSKINLKIDYQDGTVEYLSTFCSPNTYIVEQL